MFALKDKGDVSQKLEKVASCNESIFQTLVTVADLDPKKDFRGADLKGVNFSYSDLRGYDFSGADLRNTFGIEFLFDDTTILRGADLSNSSFEALGFVMKPFVNTSDEKKYQILKNNYWADQALWAMERANEKDREYTKKAAVRLFFDVNHLTVKTNILLNLNNILKDKEEYRAFLIALIGKGIEDKVSMKASIIAATQSLNTDIVLYNIVNEYLEKAEYGLFNAIVAQMLNTSYVSRDLSKIIALSNKRASKITQSKILLKINQIYRISHTSYLYLADNQVIVFSDLTNQNSINNVIKYNLEKQWIDEKRYLREKNLPFNEDDIKVKLRKKINNQVCKMYSRILDLGVK